MAFESRTGVVRSIWIAGILAIAVLQFPGLPQDVAGWIRLGSFALLIAITLNLGVPTTFGTVTFIPVAALMAYFVLGIGGGLTVLVGGQILSLALRLPRLLRQSRRERAWWVGAADALWPLAHAGISLVAADRAYRVLDVPPPLTSIDALRDLLPLIVAPVIFLLSYNTLLALDLWLRGLKIARTFVENRRVVLAIQLLPMAVAPFAAIAHTSLGLPALIMFELIVLTAAIVVYYLMLARETLERRVDQLHSFSAMNRALRTTLERDALLETVFLQIANILHIRNLHIVLKDESGGPDQWELALAVENRRIVKRSEPMPKLDGFNRWIYDQRQHLLAASVDDTATELRISNPPAGRSWIGVPLAASGRILGSIYIWLDQDEQADRVFNDSDLDLLAAIAAQTGVALENASLYEAARQQTAQLTRLNQISTVMNASLNPEKVLELVTDALIEVAGCAKASIYLYQNETGPDPVLILAHAEGFSAGHIARSRDISVPISDAERKQVLDDAKPVWVADIRAAEAQISPATLLLAKREPFTAYAYFPLRAQLKSIGMMAVYYERPHPFRQAEIDLLETFANQAALAVTNARIYHTVDIQLTQRMEQIMRMSDINQRLSASLDMGTIFNLIIDSAMDGCRADKGVLVLTGDPELGQSESELNMVAWRGFDPARSTRMPHHVAEDVARQVLTTGQTLLTSLDDPSSAGPRSQLCVPITLGERVIGALAIETERLNAFGDTDLSFASQLSVQASVAIRNAQLYTHAQNVRDRLHAILDASNDGLMMLDPRGRIVMTNARMGDFWTFASQTLTPRTTEEIMADPLSGLGEGLGYGQGELTSLLGRYTRNPALKPHSDLYEVRAVTGGQRQQRFVERSTTPVRDEQGNFIGLLMVFHDMTEQKELEEARENLTELIVHDLRAPLQTVMGGLKIINMRVKEKPSEVVQAQQVSERAVKKLLNLVNDLLDISKMETGSISLRTTVENINDIVEEVGQTVIGLNADASAVIHVEPASEALYANVDRDMIERVTLNLVDNALKHTQPGTIVTVRTAMQPATSISDQDTIAVKIIDNGTGVPDDFKEKIFDRFTQVPGQASARRSTGLGLAFCRMAVESHAGRIWVEDNPGGGSIFQFTIPATNDRPKPRAAITAKSEPAPDGNGAERKKSRAAKKDAPAD